MKQEHNTITIRRVQAETADLEKAAELFNEYRMFYEQASNIEGAREFVGDRARSGESVLFLAVIEGAEGETAVGFTQLYPSFSSISMKRLWILNDLFVTESARGKGAGRRLLEAARRHAQETNAKGLVLSTATTNTTAQALYESFGFVRDEHFYHYDLIF